MIRFFTRNLGWKLLSLGFAILLWFSIIGGPRVATAVSAPVEYRNMPRDLEISSDVPYRLHLEVQGPAGRLDPANLGDTFVVLDLSKVHRPGEQTFVIDQTKVTLPPGVTLARAVPSQIRLRFERRLSRSIPVEVRFAGPPPRGYRVSQVHVQPSRVSIAGPESRVMQVEAVETDPVDLSAVVSEAEFHPQVFVSDPQVRLESSSSVSVKVQLEKITPEDTDLNGKTTVRD